MVEPKLRSLTKRNRATTRTSQESPILRRRLAYRVVLYAASAVAVGLALALALAISAELDDGTPCPTLPRHTTQWLRGELDTYYSMEHWDAAPLSCVSTDNGYGACF